MIRKKFREFEKKWAREQKPNVKDNFRIMDSMYQEAVAIGAFPMKNPLEGIEFKIKLAKTVNYVRKSH